jgi:hypothetical protein
MLKLKQLSIFILSLAGVFISANAFADENLFGYVKGAETLPKGTLEFDQTFTHRDDKGTGNYSAWDVNACLEVHHSLRAKVHQFKTYF